LIIITHYIYIEAAVYSKIHTLHIQNKHLFAVGLGICA